MSLHALPEVVEGREVETPIGLIEKRVAVSNARRVVAYCDQHGLTWRPHIKTHKSVEMARVQLEAGARGLTVATPREAEVMSRVTPDILLAYPPVGESKLNRILSLPEGTDLKVALDSEAVLLPLARASAKLGRTTGVFVEADMGARRVGLTHPHELVALAAAAAETPGVAYRGLIFYPGHIRGPSDTQDEALRELGERLADVLRALEDAGLAPDAVSGGSTPTLWRSHEVPGLTEIRVGTAIYNDREQLSLGSAGPGDLAYTILATVVSTAIPGQAVVDAGSKAMAREERGGEGYGFLVDRPEVGVRSLSEEHGVLDLTATAWRPSIGDRVRIVPNHVCVSVNLQERLLVLEEDGSTHWCSPEGRGRTAWHQGHPDGWGLPARVPLESAGG